MSYTKNRDVLLPVLGVLINEIAMLVSFVFRVRYGGRHGYPVFELYFCASYELWTYIFIWVIRYSGNKEWIRGLWPRQYPLLLFNSAPACTLSRKLFAESVRRMLQIMRQLFGVGDWLECISGVVFAYAVCKDSNSVIWITCWGCCGNFLCQPVWHWESKRFVINASIPCSPCHVLPLSALSLGRSRSPACDHFHLESPAPLSPPNCLVLRSRRSWSYLY